MYQIDAACSSEHQHRSFSSKTSIPRMSSRRESEFARLEQLLREADQRVKEAEERAEQERRRAEDEQRSR